MKKEQKLSAEKTGKIDQISRHAAELFDAIKPEINHQRIWNSISARINHIDKTILSWFFAVATSISLLVASSIGLFEYQKQIEAPITTPSALITVAEVKPALESTKPTDIVEMQALTGRTVETMHSFVPTFMETKIEIPTVASNKVTQTTHKGDFTALKRWDGFVGVNMQYTSPAPEVGVSFNVFKFSKKEKTHKINVGLSTRLVKIKSNETNQSKIQPYTYANLIYSNTNDLKKSTWSVKAGYLLNPDQQILKNTTVKFSALKSLTPHLMIGPEIICTDGFKKSYPGISLIFNT